MSHRFKLGQYVKSIPIGNKEAFTGKIIRLDLAPLGYVLSDEMKRRWVRAEHEVYATEGVAE